MKIVDYHLGYKIPKRPQESFRNFFRLLEIIWTLKTKKEFIQSLIKFNLYPSRCRFPFSSNSGKFALKDHFLSRI